MPRRVRHSPRLAALVLLVLTSSASPQPAGQPHSTGCILNGTIYAEGSAMVTSTHCEYCYCIKGSQHCVRPHCILDVPGCKPKYNKHSCCPIKYHCSDIRNSTSTTTASSTTKSSAVSCIINGSRYLEGEMIEDVGNPCANCYCMKGKVRCEPTICPVPLETCSPVYSPGHCCPTSYNCSEVEPTTLYNNKKEEITTTEPTSVTLAISTSKTDVESTTVEGSPEILTTVDAPTNETELRSRTENKILSEDGTVRTTSAEVTTTNLPENNVSGNPVRSLPPEVIEAIINRTLAGDQDYEYDYNEPSLPPSLPNLKIIPFVAADAVVKYRDEYSTQLESKTEGPIYLDVPQPNSFSPPSKTEGGFMPRDPLLDGPFYESKFERPFLDDRITYAALTPETLLPPITEPPKLFEEGKCAKDGQTFHHGEVVSDPNACELCVCYYKQIHCQKPECNPIKAGCHWVPEKDSCCGREVCDETLTRITDSMGSTSTTPLPESMSNIPVVTVADLVVTPSNEAIRTEPPPDFVDVIKDMPPYLVNGSALENNHAVSGILDQRNVSSLNHDGPVVSAADTNKSSDIIQNAINPLALNTTPSAIKSNQPENIKNSSETPEDYDDSLSFSSVFDMLFRGETPSSKTNKPTLPSTTTSSQRTPVFDNVYGLHVPDQKQDINNAIESSDVDYFTQKSLITDKPNELSIFTDYQADESRNDTREDPAPIQKSGPDKIESKMDTEQTTGVGESGNKTIREDIGSGLLKLAGCNIYGRMYRVGRIISELSGPCLECKCTEFGVQCRKLC